jgi:hypothetical protein
MVNILCNVPGRSIVGAGQSGQAGAEAGARGMKLNYQGKYEHKPYELITNYPGKKLSFESFRRRRTYRGIIYDNY